MPSNIHLIIHDVGMGISGIISVGLAIFVYFNNPKKTTNVTFSLVMLSVAVFTFSHIIGVSVLDPYLSRAVLMFNVSIIFVVMFSVHCVLSAIGKEKKRHAVILLIYTTGIALTLFYLLFPQTFLGLSVPKMYFPNYYVAGTYQWIMRLLFDVVVPVYFMTEIVIAYRQSNNPTEKNRYVYFLVASILGYGVGSIPILLVYNIPVDPAWGVLFIFFYSIPFVYAIVKYELFNIQVIAKQAFFFAIAVVGVGGTIILLNFSIQWIDNTYHEFPFWIMPLISAFIVVALGFFVWRKIRENEALKYEFITIIAHKFRTPLTESKWATEELLHEEQDPQRLDNLKHIQQSNEKLVSLTGALVDLANTGKNTDSLYKPEKVSLNDLVRGAVAGFYVRFKEKGILFSAEYPASDIVTLADKERIMFSIQTLLENSRNYTPNGGKVTVALTQSGHKAMIRVTDTGIGIEKEELPRIFSSFYRTKKAQAADTEGFGIGLSLARSIINRHGGKMEVSSEGEGKGSTFTIGLPIV